MFVGGRGSRYNGVGRGRQAKGTLVRYVIGLIAATVVGGGPLSGAPRAAEIPGQVAGLLAEAKRVAATAGTKDDAVFAAHLLAEARRMANKPAAAALLYEKACELGSRNIAGCETAVKAAGRLLTLVPDRAADWQEALLAVRRCQYAQSRDKARTKAAGRVFEQLLVAGDARRKSGQFDRALLLYRQALAMARGTRAAQRGAILARIESATASAAIARSMRLLAERLAKNPNDLATRRELVICHLLDLDRPGQAVEILADKLDAEMRQCVPLAARKVEALDAAACGRLGQWYASLGRAAIRRERKVTAYRRAWSYLRRFLSVHQAQDVARLKAKLAFEQAGKELSRLGAATPSSRANLPKGAVLVLTFDKCTLFAEGGVPRTRDASGQKNHARPYGAKWTPGGKVGGGFTLDGTDDYLACPHAPSLNLTGPMTISLWIKMTAWDNGGGLCTKGAGMGGESWLLDMAAQRFRFIRRPNASSYSAVTSAQSAKAGAWHHVAAVADGKVLRIYVDLAETVGQAYSAKSKTNTSVVSLGSRQSGSGPFDANIAGVIDEVMIFSRALSAAEIKQLHALGQPKQPRR